MVNFDDPFYRVGYKGYVISVYIWGEDNTFFAYITDGNADYLGAAPRLYDT